jgi:hypothetical protein
MGVRDEIFRINQSCGSGIRCLFDPWIRDPRWVKKSGSGSGMNNPDQILRAYKNLSILTPKIALCGSGMENIRKNSDPG